MINKNKNEFKSSIQTAAFNSFIHFLIAILLVPKKGQIENNHEVYEKQYIFEFQKYFPYC